MKLRRHDARTPRASGRFVILAAALVAACATGGPSGEGSTAAYADPVLQEGRLPAAAEARAGELMRSAEEALDAGDAATADRAAREVVERYPASRVSGRALWLLAQATRAEGQLREADAHAERYARLLQPGDPRLAEVRLFQGGALAEAGEEAGAVRRLLALPGEASPSDTTQAVALARAAADSLPSDTLATLETGLAAGSPFTPVLRSARARRLYNEGREDEARSEAEAALQAGAAGPDAAVAQGVLDRRVDEALGLTGPVAVLGAILPEGGSPALEAYAELVKEGVEAATAGADLPIRIRMEVLDGLGTPDGSAAAARALASSGALAVVGPLQSGALAAAAAARTVPVPMISPTAPEAPLGAANVYTLLGADPGAARALARWAVGAGILRVVVVHSMDSSSQTEASAFEDMFRMRGGTVLQDLSYPAGSTSFGDALMAAASLRPDAVVLPVPARDIQVLAPQVTFFGLDTLGIGILGTAAWADEDVLSSVDRRHLDGVVAASPDLPGGEESEGHRRFVEAYERTQRKSLRSPVPALGYDAASLLLQALATGARTAESVGRALADVKDFQGATGVLSVEDGRIVRQSHVVCLRGGRLLPVPEGAAPAVYDRRPPPDTLTGERPVPQGLPFVRVCPGQAPPPDGVPVGSDTLSVPPPGRDTLTLSMTEPAKKERSPS